MTFNVLMASNLYTHQKRHVGINRGWISTVLLILIDDNFWVGTNKRVASAIVYRMLAGRVLYPYQAIWPDEVATTHVYLASAAGFVMATKCIWSLL